MSDTRHFLTLLDFSPAELQQLIRRAIEMKREHRAGNDQRAFPGAVAGHDLRQIIHPHPGLL